MDEGAAKSSISELIAKYRKYEQEGRLKELSEDDTKAIFIEPLFDALGWKTKNLDEVFEAGESFQRKGRLCLFDIRRVQVFP